MPVAEIAGELFGGIFKVIGRFFAEIVIEILLKGAGYLICRVFSKHVDPDSFLVLFVGVVFWGVIGGGVFFVYEYFQLQFAVDSCLDAGGRFNYEQALCEGLSEG